MPASSNNPTPLANYMLNGLTVTSNDVNIHLRDNVGEYYFR